MILKTSFQDNFQLNNYFNIIIYFFKMNTPITLATTIEIIIKVINVE